MYKEMFVQYLQKLQYQGPLQDVVKYLLQNERASYNRAQLTLAWCEESGGDIAAALPLALAIECLHTSSLIQDDLPCMDNSNYRREKESTHIKFNEASAILTSDILINLAYFLVSTSSLSDYNKCNAISIVSDACIGLCDGQYLDLFTKPNSLNDYLNICKLKTANLIQVASMFGVIAANGTSKQLQDASIYGELLGISYQIKDDLNDNDGIVNLISKDEAKKLITNTNQILPHYNNLFLEAVRNKVLC